MKAQTLVKRGVRQRIGSGENVRIGLDPWLSNGNFGMVETDLPIHIKSMSVGSLMVTGYHARDQDIISDLFST